MCVCMHIYIYIYITIYAGLLNGTHAQERLCCIDYAQMVRLSNSIQ